MNIGTLEKANKLIKNISILQEEITIWEKALKFENNVRLYDSDGDKLKPVYISSDDFEFIRDYMLGKLRERLAKAEEQFASL